MIRLAELAVFLAPLAAFLVWQSSVRRGVDGPAPRSLAVMFVALMIGCAGLVWLAERDRLPPGRYVPAMVVDGRVVEGHTARPGE